MISRQWNRGLLVALVVGLVAGFTVMSLGVAAQDGAGNTAVQPVPREEAWWVERHQKVNERVAQGEVDLIFIGDSITQGWEGAGKPVWDEFYGNRNAVNLGFSGDRTEHVL